MTATEYVVLVDEQGLKIGLAEKLEAHQRHLRHRAFSVFIFRQLEEDCAPELLLQKRAQDKYHTAGLWSNTCCSHPRDGEEMINAGKRRLCEEMGISTDLNEVGWFHYIAHFENGLAENEIDHVLIGYILPNMSFTPDPNEVDRYRWVTIADLEKELATTPELFTPWLKQALDLVKNADYPL